MLGAGTSASPYLISTPADLNSVRNKLTAYYELTNNIDMSTFGNFVSIGKASPYFTGSFDGKGHKIKNLTINETTGSVGLFGYINTATAIVKNVGLENCNISGGNLGNWVGLVGQNNGGSIINCWSTGQITGKYMVGGIVGQFFGGSVRNCYSTANVTGFGRVGGLIGYIANSTCILQNSYSTGHSIATEVGTAYPAGGLIGDSVVTTNVTNSFWDTTTSGLTYSLGGVGKTTAEMKTQSTYTSWDFSTIWGFNNDYPYLQVFGLPPKVGLVTVNSFSENIISGLTKSQKSYQQLQTYTDSIQSHFEREIATIRTLSTYLSQINTTATRNVRTVKSATETVYTFMKPINSFVNRESKKVTELLSYLKPLKCEINALHPLNTITPYAYVSVLKNASSTFKMDNMSTVSYIINPSYCEVME